MKQWRNRKHGWIFKELSYSSESRHIREYPSYQKPRCTSKSKDYWVRDFDPDVRIVSKSWKDQTKRRNRYKTKDI